MHFSHSGANRADRPSVLSAVVYCRISQDRDGSGLGVERQERECRLLADRLGWVVSEVLVDNDLSGSGKVKRPAFQELLAGLRQRRWSGLVTYAQDRLTRNMRELEDVLEALEEGGAQVASVTGGNVDLATPAGRAMVRVIGAMARQETEQKAARQRSKAREVAEAGRPSGGGNRPYGFERDGITHRPEEADALREAAKDILSGGSLTSWSKKLGIQRKTLRRALTSPRLAGLREHNGKLYKAVWEPIISPDERLRLVALLDRNTEPVKAPRYLLSGLLHCGRCGARMVPHTVPRATGKRVRRWNCKACNGNGILAEPLEKLVEDTVTEWWSVDLPDPSTLADSPLRGVYEVMARAFGHRPPVQSNGAAETLEQIEAREAELLDLLAAGDLSPAEWRIVKADLAKRKEAAAEQVVTETATSWRPWDRWEAADVEQRNRILRRFLSGCLVVMPGTVDGPRGFRPERLVILDPEV
jgi:site-specific DNA recombinase